MDIGFGGEGGSLGGSSNGGSTTGGSIGGCITVIGGFSPRAVSSATDTLLTVAVASPSTAEGVIVRCASVVLVGVTVLETVEATVKKQRSCWI